MSMTPINAGNTQFFITASSTDPFGGGASVQLSRIDNGGSSKYVVVFGEYSNTQLVLYDQDESGGTIDTVILDSSFSVPTTATDYYLGICGNDLTIFDSDFNLIATYTDDLIGDMIFTDVSNEGVPGTSITLNSVNQSLIPNFCASSDSSTSSSNSTSNSISSSSTVPGLSAGAITGIVIGSVVFLAIVLASSWLGYKYYKKNKK
jgi:hypothetical protein